MAYINGHEILQVVKTNYLSETERDLVARYHLGAYDSIQDNGDGTTTITRQTGYVDLGTLNYNYENNARFVSNVPNLKSLSGRNTNVKCSKYTTSIDSGNNTIFSSNGNIYIYDSSYNDANTFKASVSGVILQYELETSYTEKVITNQPLNTLDSNGSQWGRSEWEKGLNLWSNGDISVYNKTYGQYLPAGTYTYSFNLNSNTPEGVVIKIGSTIIVSDAISVGYHSYTFTITGLGENLTHIQYGGNSTKVMLNKGNHAYPYQAYNGNIVHEKDVADIIKNLVGTYHSGFGTVASVSTLLYDTKFPRVYTIENSDVDGQGNYSKIKNEVIMNFNNNAGGNYTIAAFKITSSGLSQLSTGAIVYYEYYI